jgi:SNARE protein
MSSPQEAENAVGDAMRRLENAVSEVRQESELKDKKIKEREARKVFRDAKTAINAMRREVNRIEDPSQRSVYARQHTAHNDKLAGYDRELRTLLRPARGGAAAGSDATMTGIMGEMGDGNDAQKVLRAANRAQDDNLQILQRVERDVMVTEELGNEIAIRLQTDTEKIAEIDRELNTLQANLERAKGEVQWFARQMATDKCFLVLIVMVVLGLCLLTFWKMYRSRGKGGNDEPAPIDRSTPPPPPVTPPPTTVAPATTTTVPPTTAPVATDANVTNALLLWAKWVSH